MQPVRNEKNQILNTFTGIPEPDGKAHFFVEHDENGVRFKLYSPQEGKEFNDVVLNQYVNSQQMYGQKIISWMHGTCTVQQNGRRFRIN